MGFGLCSVSGMDSRTRRLLTHRVAERFAGYTGWDPPDDEPEDPDPSEPWDEAVKMFPHSMHHLFEHPKQDEKRRQNDVAISLTKLIELSDDSGIELTATATQGTDADEDGLYSYSHQSIEYGFNTPHKSWSGTAHDYELSRKFKHDLHEFLEALKATDPEAATKAGL